jgi:hypothetical protein
MARPQAGETSAIIDGEVVNTVVTTTQFETTIKIGDSISVTIDVVDEQGNSVEISPQGVVQASRGYSIIAEGNVFLASSPIEAWLNSDPIYLGTGQVDVRGSFANTFAINSEVPFGEHTFVLHGLSPTNQVVSVALGIEVLDAGSGNSSLIGKGSDLLAKIALAVFALLLALYLISTRRRQTARH